MDDIRFDSIKLDKILIDEYSKEIALGIKESSGLNDLNRYARKFENEFLRYIQGRYCTVMDSGTGALQLALLCSGIGKDDLVIVPAISHPATAWAVKSIGAQPVFVDIKQEDLTIDTDKIENVLDKRVKAIIPVHLYGMVCDMASISRIAQKHKLKVIEDACHALGSTYNNKKTGILGDFGVFSFAYFKTLSSINGRGGCLITGKEKYVGVIKKTLADEWGSVIKFGAVSFLDLAVLIKKIKLIHNITGSKINIQNNYIANFKGIKSITLLKPARASKALMMLFPILTKKRDLLNDELRKHKVICQMPYKPLYSLFNEFNSGKNNYPVAERYTKEALMLPAFAFMKLEEVNYVADIVKSVLK